MTAFFDWIINLAQSIWDVIGSAISFLINTVISLWNLLKSLPLLLQYLNSIVGNLPSFINVFIVATLSIAIIYLILGRSKDG